MDKIYTLNNIVSIELVKSKRLESLFKWETINKVTGFLFWKKEQNIKRWISFDYGLVCYTDEELLDFLSSLNGGESKYFIKNKILYNKPHVIISFNNGEKYYKFFEDETFAEIYINSLKRDLTGNGIGFRDLSKDLF